MSGRPGIAVTAKIPADGGESPNKYAPEVSVHIRVNWPPLATWTQVQDAIQTAYIDALYTAREARREDG